MTTTTGPRHAPGPAGAADRGPEAIGELVLACWDDFLDVATASGTDLSRPSRLPGWSGKDLVVHLGSWPESPVLRRLLASAEAGGDGAPDDPDALNARVVAAHRDATVDEALAAAVEARDGLERFFGSPQARELATALSTSAVGPFPLLGLLHAGCYELAVHAADLGRCGAPAPSERLLDAGLAALIDVTGGLAARSAVEIELTAMTPQGGWAFTSSAAGWTTTRVPAGDLPGTGVRGTALDLLEVSAGRTALLPALASRRLVVARLPSWMRLAPILDDVPGLPGGSALKSAVGGLSGVTGAVGRLLRRG